MTSSKWYLEFSLSVLSFPCINHCKALKMALPPPTSKDTETTSSHSGLQGALEKN